MQRIFIATKTKRLRLALLSGFLMVILSQSSFSQNSIVQTPSDAQTMFGLSSLSSVPVPEPANLANFVIDKQVAIALGKAFFWDKNVGSDGQACASCHFHAGADSRIKNQLNPGLKRVVDPTGADNPDTSFGDYIGMTASGGLAGPNYVLNINDFPFHKLSDPTDRNSTVLFEMNDVTSSQGTFGADFLSVHDGGIGDILTPFDGQDNCNGLDSSVFGVAGIATRKVEPRNTPTVVNAVFNHRNFWDGRASNIFNGINPLGKRGNLPTTADSNPGVLAFNIFTGKAETVQIELENASLASQAVGPALSDFEMSCAGRAFVDLGKKMLDLRPLNGQTVDATDSTLGEYVTPLLNGLNTTYRILIQQAFNPIYWLADNPFQLFDAFGEPLPLGATHGFTQMEVNFSLFWGLAIQLYEATLISDQTPFDKWMEGDENSGFGAQELAGLNIFVGKGRCINCHVGAEFTAAAVRFRANQPDGDEESIERMLMGDGGTALYDGGFYNIGVRPTVEDLGVGADLAGFPLSFARQEATGNKIDQFNFDNAKFEIPGPVVPGERVAVDGAFKVPTLRNAELTGPYFHNGGQASLAQVVEFYNRGGDRRQTACQSGNGDSSGFATQCSNVDPDIVSLDLTQTEQRALVSFMLSLTDDRVRRAAAPFDHPELAIPNGHSGDQFMVNDDGTGKAVDSLLVVPATGASGGVAVDTFLGVTH